MDKLLRCVNAFIDRRVFFGFDVCYFLYTVSVNYDDCIFKSYWRTHRVGIVSSRPQPHPTQLNFGISYQSMHTLLRKKDVPSLLIDDIFNWNEGN